ncbi:DUF2645 family protein [Gilliamella sp. Pas-s27]|uniref:DUF2645 family protein n=1 Tax=Gilliamella sp. Pas-s27 TaxID=2687311 RepID=UPI0013653969|nr:DUF2645 family protein [Gilliamella sp. Pas-s27]
MKYFFATIYAIFCFFIIFVFSTNKHEYWLELYPEEFLNLCMLPTGNDNDPQSDMYIVLVFLLPLLIPLFLSKKKEKLFISVIILLLFAFWVYSFIIRFSC